MAHVPPFLGGQRGKGFRLMGKAMGGAFTNLFFVSIAFRQRERVMDDTQE